MTREEALKEIKPWDFLEGKEIEAIQTLISELKESEDERIRRTLVEYFGPQAQLDFIRGVPIQKIRDWLEKQKEQKQEWSEEDEKMLNEVLDRVTYAFYNQGLDGEIEDDPAFLWLHRLRPSWKPSEEQMDRLFSIVATLRKDYCDDMADFLANLYTDLEKLGVKKDEKI